MTPLTCALCKQTLTMGIWDRLTEQVYCAQCLPPLPPVRTDRVRRASRSERLGKDPMAPRPTPDRDQSR